MWGGMSCFRRNFNSFHPVEFEYTIKDKGLTALLPPGTLLASLLAKVQSRPLFPGPEMRMHAFIPSSSLWFRPFTRTLEGTLMMVSWEGSPTVRSPGIRILGIQGQWEGTGGSHCRKRGLQTNQRTKQQAMGLPYSSAEDH